MRPLAELPRETARAIGYVFTDVDDTLTWRGKLVPEAYAALARARDAGLRVVCVTGRPGGWAEVLSALWPVEAVVAENGALAVLDGGRALFWEPDEYARGVERGRLEALAATLLGRLPFARLAADSPLRRVDVAFDVGERARLEPAQIAALVEGIHAGGARSLVSTVHAHAFFGGHDKAAMLMRVAGELWGASEAEMRARALFVGDSPNDQAGFAAFPLSAGPSNVARFAARLAPPPAWIATGAGGHGFAEIIATLLALRAGG